MRRILPILFHSEQKDHCKIFVKKYGIDSYIIIPSTQDICMEVLLYQITKILLPLIAYYHLLTDHSSFNVVSPDAKGIERVADYALIPFHYIFGGKILSKQELSFRFNYDHHLLVKSSTSLVTLPLSIAIGIPLKALSLRFSKCALDLNQTVRSHIAYYRSVGIPIDTDRPTELDSPIYARRPEEVEKFKIECEALRAILHLFNRYHILYWADCGTCLGAYRYRGVIPWDDDIDLAILLPDHENVKLALSELDSRKYQVQDWSNRGHPHTYLRVYIKATKSLIDIYHFYIDEKNRTLSYILSNESSAFLPTTWKLRESRYTIPTPFSMVFPLARTPFEDMEISIPRQTKEYLQLRYGEDLSPVKLFNSHTQKYEKNFDHPYWKQENPRPD